MAVGADLRIDAEIRRVPCYETFDSSIFDPEAFDVECCDGAVFQDDSFQRDSFSVSCCDVEAFNEDAFNKDAFDVECCDEVAFDTDGFDEDTFDVECTTVTPPVAAEAERRRGGHAVGQWKLPKERTPVGADLRIDAPILALVVRDLFIDHKIRIPVYAQLAITAPIRRSVGVELRVDAKRQDFYDYNEEFLLGEIDDDLPFLR